MLRGQEVWACVIPRPRRLESILPGIPVDILKQQQIDVWKRKSTSQACADPTLQLPQLCWVVTPQKRAGRQDKTTPLSCSCFWYCSRQYSCWYYCLYCVVTFSILLLCGGVTPWVGRSVVCSVPVCSIVGSSADVLFVVLSVATVSLGLLFAFGGGW